MKSFQLSEVIGADMPSYFYIDGVRVSRTCYTHLKERADRLDCFSTKGRQLSEGRIRRTNYVCAYFVD